MYEYKTGKSPEKKDSALCPEFLSLGLSGLDNYCNIKQPGPLRRSAQVSGVHVVQVMRASDMPPTPPS